MENLELQNVEAKRNLREFALKVLDDPEGIRIDAYAILRSFLQDNGSEDIIAAIDVDEKNGRVFIGEDYAEDALRDISKWAEAMSDIHEVDGDENEES